MPPSINQPPPTAPRKLRRDEPLPAGTETSEERRLKLRRMTELARASGRSHRWTREEAVAANRKANFVRWGWTGAPKEP